MNPRGKDGFGFPDKSGDQRILGVAGVSYIYSFTGPIIQVKKREIYWVIGSLLIAFLLKGLLFGFDYSKEVDIQLHDTYFLAPPLHFVLLFWVLLIFLIFLIRGFNKLNLLSTWILFVSNTILIAIVLAYAYILFAFFSTDALVDLFKESKRIDTIADQFNKGIMICAILIVGLGIGEVFLIRRLIKLRKAH